MESDGPMGLETAIGIRKWLFRVRAVLSDPPKKSYFGTYVPKLVNFGSYNPKLANFGL
jgi:hypothetical protein